MSLATSTNHLKGALLAVATIGKEVCEKFIVGRDKS